ncbi:hypothetical protein [Polyangium sp. 15x6]|uniref:hypothetical protein n=1 Tax=Polyangium sp. 15x6 TaxID=3042687 RepID=UPI00249B66DF|nr:hypothetical protein [Polyangium sp. 15x6]MDI3287040.1 hypothetical protein [Polyangium sp. 15x6]
MKDGTLVVPRFGGGTAGDVVYARPDGTNGVVPNLDPLRRRIGLTVSEEGTLYDTFFVAMNGIKLGSVAELDLAGAEAEIITGLKNPSACSPRRATSSSPSRRRATCSGRRSPRRISSS